MGEIDAAGEIVTGALLGRAVEPAAGEGGGHGDVCLNCGTALVGPHCHNCGQSGHIHRSLGAVGHEILHGVVHFEGKLWRTLPMLAWRPGELTRRYIEGERARFVSPTALFLFSIFTLFAVFSLFGITPQAGKFGITPKNDEQVQAVRETLNKTRAQFVASRDALPAGDERTKSYDAQIAAIDKELGEVAVGRIVQGPISTDIDIETGWSRLDHGVEKAIKNPSLTTYKLQSNSYKFSWALILLSLPFVWLAFAWRRDFHLYDHAVFVTYSIAFMSLLFIALTLLGAMGVGAEWLRTAAGIIVPLHLYHQLKGGYSLTRTGAVLRTIYLLVVAGVVLTVFLLGILALNLLG